MSVETKCLFNIKNAFREKRNTALFLKNGDNQCLMLTFFITFSISYNFWLRWGKSIA